jgi:hypothetical protein
MGAVRFVPIKKSCSVECVIGFCQVDVRIRVCADQNNVYLIIFRLGKALACEVSITYCLYRYREDNRMVVILNLSKNGKSIGHERIDYDNDS